MTEGENEFRALVGAILARFCAQNGQPAPSDPQAADFAARLWALVVARGLPPPLARGAPDEMTEAECALLAAQVVDPDAAPLLAEAARQLAKACFYPEFKTCRESFREVTADGSCRRQDLARARRRTSGAHCVDCPYWIALNPAPHGKFLARHWRAGAADFAAQRGVFLPEDFRAFRRWVRAAAASGRAPAQ